MNTKDIDLILSLLNKNDIESLKELLINEKNKNLSEALLNYLNKYITLIKKDTELCKNTHYILKDEQLIFTNGISIYYINKNFSVYAKEYLYRLTEFEKSIKRPNSIVQITDNEKLKLFEDSIEKPRNCFLKVENEQVNGETVSLENISYKGNNNYTCQNFSNSEISIAKKILNNPEFYVDMVEPIATAESEIGKVYIKGFKNTKK